MRHHSALGVLFGIILLAMFPLLGDIAQAPESARAPESFITIEADTTAEWTLSPWIDRDSLLIYERSNIDDYVKNER